MLNNVLMAKKPNTNHEQYRKAAKMVRVRTSIASQAKIAAESLAQDLTQFVNDAVREKLERMNLWPLAEDRD